jgi:hypothetical protein
VRFDVPNPKKNLRHDITWLICAAVDPHQLPPEYGGKCDCNPCIPSLGKYTGPKPPASSSAAKNDDSDASDGNDGDVSITPAAPEPVAGAAAAAAGSGKRIQTVHVPAPVPPNDSESGDELFYDAQDVVIDFI